jgi:hypothetical protein
MIRGKRTVGRGEIFLSGFIFLSRTCRQNLKLVLSICIVLIKSCKKKIRQRGDGDMLTHQKFRAFLCSSWGFGAVWNYYKSKDTSPRCPEKGNHISILYYIYSAKLNLI